MPERHLPTDPDQPGRPQSGTPTDRPTGLPSAQRDDFGRQVLDALTHLYDLSYLQTHPLIARLTREPRRRGSTSGQSLRQELAAAVEALRPDPAEPEDPAGTRAWRAHQLLTLRYVEALTVPAVCQRLGVSEREFYRDHRQALDAVVSLLRERWGLAEGAAETPSGQAPRAVAPPAAPTPAPAPAPAPRHNLPAALTSFVGRERELATLRELLRSARLLTLTGTGGCGKTRLALELARRQQDEHPDGVWLVDLAPLADAALVAPSVATALGVREEAGQPLLAALVRHLQPRRLLLLLDNCEHLLDACAPLVEALLRGCVELRVLATSRQRLGVAGEVAWWVPSLSVPDPAALATPAELARSEAVRLLVERARLVRPGFEVSERNAAAVAELCWRLDGIPLAVELVAARLTGLSVEQAAARLRDRFWPLTGGSRTAVRRQQTLRATLDWSYDLLTEPERALLRRLAVFAGGWELEAAEAVCSGEGVESGDVLELLLALVDQSLVVAETREPVRYRLLETIRQYAGEKLLESGEAAAVRDRHLAWCLALPERAAPELERGREPQTWLARLRVEHDNLRAALDWSLARDDDASAATRLAEVLLPFWHGLFCLSEIRERLSRILPGPARDPRARVLLLSWTGALASVRGDWRQASERGEEALAMARELGDPGLVALSLVRLSHVRFDVGDLSGAQALLEEALPLARRSGSPRVLALALHFLADCHHLRGDFAGARPLWEEALEHGRSSGDPGLVAHSLFGLCRLAQDEGDYVRARLLVEAGLAAARVGGPPGSMAVGGRHLGDLARAEGDLVAAGRHYQESLEVLRQTGHELHLTSTLLRVAGLSAARGERRRAAVLFAAIRAWHAARGISALYRPHRGWEQDEAAARAALGEAAWAAATAKGRALTLEQAVEHALGEDDGA